MTEQPKQPSETETSSPEVEAELPPSSSDQETINFDVFEVEGEGQQPDWQVGAVPVKPEIVTITKDEFFGVFQAMFGTAGFLTGLKSLPIKDHETLTAREASDAIYDTALEVPFLRFLIEPQNIWVQRSMAIGIFAFGKYSMVQAELRAEPKPEGGADAEAA